VTTPLTGTIDEIAAGNAGQVLRFRKLAVLMANYTDPAITTIVDSTDGTTLSIAGEYKTVGYLDSQQGGVLTPSMTTSDSMAYGKVQPINEYTTARGLTVAFTMKESQKTVFEGYYGLDLSAIQAKSTTKEITWDVPDLPPVFYKRILLLGQHGDGADAIWGGQFLPRCALSDIGAQTYSDADDFVYPVTYKTLTDDAIGTGQRPFFAGPGLASLGATPLGFTVGA